MRSDFGAACRQILEKPCNAGITFTDTGKGISPENLPRIFDPGFTTKGVGVGSGLGLPICYKITKEHGGRIDVRSELGRGTTFTVSLPINASARQRA